MTDAKRVLRAVQNRRKVLEENLEAVIHAKERDFFHDYLDALSSGNRLDATTQCVVSLLVVWALSIVLILCIEELVRIPEKRVYWLFSSHR